MGVSVLLTSVSPAWSLAKGDGNGFLSTHALVIFGILGSPSLLSLSFFCGQHPWCHRRLFLERLELFLVPLSSRVTLELLKWTRPLGQRLDGTYMYQHWGWGWLGEEGASWESAWTLLWDFVSRIKIRRKKRKRIKGRGEKEKEKWFREPPSGKASRISLSVSYRERPYQWPWYMDNCHSAFVGLASLSWESSSLKRQKADTKRAVYSPPRPTLAQQVV